MSINRRNKYQNCFLILTACASVCVLYYFIQLSVFTAKIDIDINVHQFDNGGKQSYPDKFESSYGNGGKGFILVGRYYEQQTGAAMNLLTLSQWAKTVGAFPVEPFVTKSSFHNQVRESILKDPLYFRDYFDIEFWNKMCLNVSAMPLISWDTFITHNPGNFILVFNTGKETSKLALVNDEIMNDVVCKEEFLQYEPNLQNYTTHTLGISMKIVRRVCISFSHRKPIHIYNFTNIIYGNLDPSNVVVWFQTWRGIMGGLRVKIIEKQYARNIETVKKMLQNSKRVVGDSNKYIRNVLNSDFGQYVAISVRFARRAHHFYYEKEEGSMMLFFHTCISKLKKTVNLINSTNIPFLAQDLGRYGDTKDSKYLTDDMVTTIENELFQSLYNGKLTMEKWEQQFVEVTGGITDSGYIAAMQSEILKNSRCIIMFGGDSNFQRNVLYQYKQRHSTSNHCVHEVCYIQ